MVSAIGHGNGACIRENLDMRGRVAYPFEMNLPFPKTTNAAEGMLRRRFTVAELERMVEVGILEEDERIELIGGDVVPMAPKSLSHERLKSSLNLHWVLHLPLRLVMTPETTFRFTEDTYLEPDFVFYLKETGLKYLSASTAKLVVEIADTSLSYDLGRKANLYAGFGIVELWVINAVTLQTRIHRDPTPTGYRSMGDFLPTDRMAPLHLPSLAVTLSELELH